MRRYDQAERNSDWPHSNNGNNTDVASTLDLDSENPTYPETTVILLDAKPLYPSRSKLQDRSRLQPNRRQTPNSSVPPVEFVSFSARGQTNQQPQQWADNPQSSPMTSGTARTNSTVSSQAASAGGDGRGYPNEITTQLQEARRAIRHRIPFTVVEDDATTEIRKEAEEDTTHHTLEQHQTIGQIPLRRSVDPPGRTLPFHREEPIDSIPEEGGPTISISEGIENPPTEQSSMTSFFRDERSDEAYEINLTDHNDRRDRAMKKKKKCLLRYRVAFGVGVLILVGIIVALVVLVVAGDDVMKEQTTLTTNETVYPNLADTSRQKGNGKNATLAGVSNTSSP